MENKMIDINQLYFKYDNEDKHNDKMVIQGIDLAINKGEFVVVLGSNGSGKSTLAKQMNALLIPSSGKVLVDSLDTSDADNVWKIRNKAGMVFQNPDNQIVATIVEEDVAFGPENLGIEPSEIRKRVDNSLESVHMLDYKKHAPYLLSGGQKQRVAIAGILAMRPSCIIFDEPTAMLDPVGRKEVFSTIRNLNKEYGITVILITHFMEEAVEADRIIVMDNGKMVKQGTPKEIFKDVTGMKKAGLDVPQVTELAFELKNSGIDIDTDIITINEMVNKLCQLKLKI